MWQRDPNLYISTATKPVQQGWPRGQSRAWLPSSSFFAEEPHQPSPLLTIGSSIPRFPLRGVQPCRFQARVAGERQGQSSARSPSCCLWVSPSARLCPKASATTATQTPGAGFLPGPGCLPGLLCLPPRPELTMTLLPPSPCLILRLSKLKVPIPHIQLGD